MPTRGFRFTEPCAGLVAAVLWNPDTALFVRRGDVSHEAKGKIVVFNPSEEVEFFVLLNHSFATFAYLSDAHADLDDKTAGYLKAQGFVMHDPRSLVTPDRTSLEVSPRSPWPCT